MDNNFILQNSDKTINYIKTTDIVNVENKDIWMHPWNVESFDDLYNRDERFFAVVLKGMLSWLNRNIVMYNKQINHFIFNTGSSYLYIEDNGYEFSWSETTGEDQMYMHLPRCVVQLNDINLVIEELSQPHSKGVYERRSDNLINGYCAEIYRIPIEINITLKYVLANFNESIILIQEFINKIVFQQYYNITYLGNIIQCSIEFPQNFTINLNEIDMEAKETNRRTIELPIKICTNYPIINEKSEIQTDKVIQSFGFEINIDNSDKETIDKENIKI